MTNVVSLTSRYVIKQVAKPLLATLGIGLLMLMAERLVRLLDITLGKKNSFGVVFEMLAYLMPHYIGTAIPAALFLGLLFGFNKLSKSSELDAINATGTGLSQLLIPVMWLAFFLALISLLIVGWLQPLARYAYRATVYDAGNVEVFYLAEAGVFMQAGNRTFILDKLDRSTNSFDRVFLFENSPTKGLETVTATKGMLIPVPGEIRPVLRLEDGHRLRLKQWPDVNSPAELPLATVTDFTTSETPLGSLSPKLFRERGGDERELTFPELLKENQLPENDKSASSGQAELHLRIVHVLTLLMLPILAIPFAIGRQRSGRGYRFGVALVLVIAFHEIIEQGAVTTKASGVSPWLTMWLPFLLLTLYAIWRFYTAAYTLKPDRLSAAIDAIGAALDRATRPVIRRFRIGARS